MLPVGHHQKIAGVIVGCITIHVVYHLSCLQRSSKMLLCNSSGFLRIGFPSNRHAAVGIASVVQLCQVLRPVSTGESRKIYMLPIPLVPMLHAAEILLASLPPGYGCTA